MASKRATLRDRLRYAFDNSMSRGPTGLIAWLAAASLALILGISLLVTLMRAVPDRTFVEVVWMSLLRTLDAGTMGADQGTWPFLLSMFVITLGGIFVISTLIGILSNDIAARLENLRRGRSLVLEHDHTAILGWSEQVFTIVSELVQAEQSRKGACIAILAEQDKLAMEEAITQKCGRTGRTRIVCRNGRPMEPADLEIVNLPEARAIIVLSPDSDDPDAEVIKTLLAITNAPERLREGCVLVAEVREPRNMAAARLACRGVAQLVLVSDLIARIAAQTCRQSGLSVVYTELLNFSGDEIYFHTDRALPGVTFGEALLRGARCTVIGVCPQGGQPALNPPMDTVLREGDRLIVLAADDSEACLERATPPEIDRSAIAPVGGDPAQPEHTLVLGWNWRGAKVIQQLDAYVAPGSEVTVVADEEQAEQAQTCCVAALRNQAGHFLRGDTTDGAVLEGLDLAAFDHVIVLSCCDQYDAQQADARTLITLLHLRHLALRAGWHASITSEMIDVRNRRLAEVTGADDFIVSDQLASLMLAQVSQNAALNAVFEDLLNPEGSELYLKPAGDYVLVGRAVSFDTVVQSARQRGQVALGYRLAAHHHDPQRAYGVVLNPDKAARVTFAPDDRIVVLAES